MKKKVIAIVGPTAVGKTELSIELAKKINGEIISGDSMQVYKGMDIGTAKISTEDMQGIPHYMLNIKEPNEPFSVADFQTHVQDYVTDIHAKNKIPIIVGGSGFYIQATLYNYNFSSDKRDDDRTKALEKQVSLEGIIPLYERLKEIDPVQAKKIHPNNHRRVIRAIEIYETTGKTMTESEKEQQTESPYDLALIGLEMERKQLYSRINERVDAMMAEGLLEEVKSFYDQGLANCQSMKAIGYKEFIPYFQGEESLEHCVDVLKRNSRRYAKRQYTWFRNRMNVTWYHIEPASIKETFQNISNHIAGIFQSK